MSKRSRYTKEEKYEILKEIELGNLSIEDVCQKYQMVDTTYRNWRFQYETYGLEGLKESRTWKKYSNELKQEAVLEYLNGKDSLLGICRKYGISGKSLLDKWVKRYNGHNEVKTTKGREATVMTKARSTTLKERIEITKYCLSQEKNYNETSKIYNVSYQQIYQWVKKYEEFEEDGLEDRRGKAKLELNEEDKIKIDMKRLKTENERLRMENDFLKKLQELERRGY